MDALVAAAGAESGQVTVGESRHLRQQRTLVMQQSLEGRFAAKRV
jgi:hypothetical protein